MNQKYWYLLIGIAVGIYVVPIVFGRLNRRAAATTA